MEIFGDLDIGDSWRLLEIFGKLDIGDLDIEDISKFGYWRFVDVQKIHVFLMKYIHFCMLSTKNVHFPHEILIFWLLWEAKNAARARGHTGDISPGRIACWDPKKKRFRI